MASLSTSNSSVGIRESVSINFETNVVAGWWSGIAFSESGVSILRKCGR